MTASPEEIPVKTPFKRVLAFWDSALLGLVVLSLSGMTGYLLWPEPLANLKLNPIPVASGVVETAPETIQAEPEIQPHQSRKEHHRGMSKKPEKPSVLNLNTATIQQFQLLPGIGPKMAQRIIEYRKTKGPFQSTEQIMDVKGIGIKKYEKLKPFLKL